jgi:hypothetical protein
MRQKKKAARRGKRVLWTSADVKLLRQQAGKQSLAQLGRALKRSPAAVRFKASALRISLRRR